MHHVYKKNVKRITAFIERERESLRERERERELRRVRKIQT